MKIFCIEEFKLQYEKLRKKSSYASLEKDILEHFFDRDLLHLKAGTRLNNSDDTPYIKKRLNGSGGFRIYYLLIVVNESAYLLFVHPKTGSLGYDNISDESKALLYKRALQCIKEKELFEMTAVDGKLVIKKAE